MKELQGLNPIWVLACIYIVIRLYIKGRKKIEVEEVGNGIFGEIIVWNFNLMFHVNTYLNIFDGVYGVGVYLEYPWSIFMIAESFVNSYGIIIIIIIQSFYKR